MRRQAIFLSGPIGVGKTAYGRGLSAFFKSGFIDGDDFSDSCKPWYCSALRTSKAIVNAGLAALEENSTVIIAYPLGCINWIYYRRRFGDAGIGTLFVSLRATYESIVDAGRGRQFDEKERQRIQIMIDQGYCTRRFSDLILDTGRDSFENTLSYLAFEIKRRIDEGCPPI